MFQAVGNEDRSSAARLFVESDLIPTLSERSSQLMISMPNQPNRLTTHCIRQPAAVDATQDLDYGARELRPQSIS